jgi:hypothetical protein
MKIDYYPNFFDRVMKIENRGAAPPDIDFGLEPRALAPDLKSLPQNIQIDKT